MATKFIVTAVSAVLAGGAGYLIGNGTNGKEPAPIAPSKEIVTKVLAAHQDGQDFDSLDPITRKHLTLQLWYSYQASATGILSADSGHEFGPIWNRRDPIEILEEQTAFMGSWLEELKELERNETKAEQGVAPQSATRSESESEGGEKPQPESEPRPR